MIFTFTGLKPGTTTVSVYGRSPIIENNDSIYTAVVDENLNVTLKSVRKISTFFMYRDADIDYNTYSVSYGQDGYHVSVNYEEEQKIDEESVDALIAVIDEYGVERWNGFSESERHGPIFGHGVITCFRRIMSRLLIRCRKFWTMRRYGREKGRELTLPFFWKTTSGVVCPQVWKKVTSEKVTSGVVCPQVWKNYPRGRFGKNYPRGRIAGGISE